MRSHNVLHSVHRNPINLLRAVAVLMVFCHHYAQHVKTPIPWVGVYGGMLGVQLFFLISGYLIVKTASQHNLTSFMRGRIFRIYPTYWTILLIASYVYQPVIPYAASDAPYFWINFFAYSHFVPYALGMFDVLSVSWTLTIEWTWYIITPALLSLGKTRWINQRTGHAYWALVLLAAIVLQWGWNLSVSSGLLDNWYDEPIKKLGFSSINDDMRTLFMYAAAPAQLAFFVIGACIWAYEDTLKKLPPICWLALGTGILALPQLWMLGIHLNPSFVSGFGLAALFIYALQNASTLSHPLLRPLHWVGDWSFPLYLLHVPVFLTGVRIYKVSGASGFVACLAVALALSCAVHWLVERPSRRLNHML